MTIAYRSDTGTLNADGVTSPQTISFPAGKPTAGDLVVAGGSLFGNASAFTPAVTDNQGNGTYTNDSTGYAITNSSRVLIARKENVAFPSGTFTVSFATGISGSGNYFTVSAQAFSGVATSSPLDANPAVHGLSGNLSSLASNATGTLAQADEVIICAVATDSLSPVDVLSITPSSGFTNTSSRTDGGSGVVGAFSYKIVSATTTVTNTYTYGASSGNAGDGHAVAIASYKGATAAAPTVTDVNTTEVIADAQTGVAVTGTGMGTTNADRTFALVQGSTAVNQTETGTGTSTAATLTIAVDQSGADIKFGSATMRVTRASDSLTGTLAVTVNPPTGQLYVDVVTPDPTASNRITAVSDIASGDQIQARGVGGGAAPSGLTLNDDATFTFSGLPASFDVRVWDTSDSTWGTWGTQFVGAAVPLPMRQARMASQFR